MKRLRPDSRKRRLDVDWLESGHDNNERLAPTARRKLTRITDEDQPRDGLDRVDHGGELLLRNRAGLVDVDGSVSVHCWRRVPAVRLRVLRSHADLLPLVEIPQSC
jgi:hypothetical protein